MKSIRTNPNSAKGPDKGMAIPPTDIRILFTNYDIIAFFSNLASCSEHFISIKHRIFAISLDFNFRNSSEP
jgi:hypothetical protein